jgi:hypothetical protein
MLHGLRTVIYHVEELGRAKGWYAEVLGKEPYFDEPFYVGAARRRWRLPLRHGRDRLLGRGRR